MVLCLTFMAMDRDMGRSLSRFDAASDSQRVGRADELSPECVLDSCRVGVFDD